MGIADVERMTLVKRGLLNFLQGVLFVVVTLILWRILGELTWWAGSRLFFEPETPGGVLVGAATTGSSWTDFLRFWEGFGAGGRLPLLVTIVLLLVSIWISARTFFPDRTPEELR
jgi:hypothetical protein